MSYIVYVHTNKINNKKYIGITSTSLKKRSRNGEGYKGCDKFYYAIQKYGWNNFTHNILYRNLTKQEAELKEKELIKEYNTQIDGYNIDEGGFSPVMTQETKDKISKSHYDNHRRRVVVYLPSGKYRVYESINEAANIMKVDKKIIKGWCDGTIPTTKIKCYYEDDMDYYYEKLRQTATFK
jgi:hypothetical protein